MRVCLLHKVKRLVVPDALKVLRLQHGHKFCKLGDLSNSVSCCTLAAVECVAHDNMLSGVRSIWDCMQLCIFPVWEEFALPLKIVWTVQTLLSIHCISLLDSANTALHSIAYLS